jgi:hypothetical protein
MKKRNLNWLGYLVYSAGLILTIGGLFLLLIGLLYR